jgi:hypothetical protein
LSGVKIRDVPKIRVALTTPVADVDVFRGTCVSVKLSNRDVAASERWVSPAVVAPIDRSSQGGPTSRQALERPSTQPAPPAKFAAVRPRGSDGGSMGEVLLVGISFQSEGTSPPSFVCLPPSCATSPSGGGRQGVWLHSVTLARGALAASPHYAAPKRVWPAGQVKDCAAPPGRP